MARKFKCLVGLILLFIYPSVINAGTGKIIVRGSSNYPPFEYINKKGEPEGFNVDVFHALMKELGYDYELKLDDWNAVIRDIENKKIDVAIGMIYSKERAANVRFTLPTCAINRNFITRKSDNIRSVEDLKGKEIIVEKGGWFHQYLKDTGLAGKIIESGDIYESLKLLKEGKHDVVLAGDLVAHYAIKHLELKDLYVGDLGITPQNYAIVVNQDRDELLYQFNIGLQHLKQTGVYDQIYNKWFGIYESQKNRKSLLIAIAVFLTIASVLILFVWLLRKRVAKATRMLNSSNEELEEYRLKTEFIINTNEIILIQYDLNSRTFTRVNEQAGEQHHVFTVEQYFELVYPEDLGAAKQLVAKLNKAELHKIESEFRIINKDGSYQWYNITAVAYKYDKQGMIISYMGLRRNNTKWKTINNDLIELREKAEESNRLKSAFLANMSHEIRTPLNAIVGFSELITETEDQNEKALFIEIVKKNNELLLQLINDVLDLSRIEAGYINFSFTSFDFPTYLKELYVSLKLREPKDVELICIDSNEDLNIHSDSNRISQVITNFVTNAFKFTVKGSVTLSYIYENEGIRISVTDTGIGIAPENLERIFERFEKVNDFAQGTGLGLAICKVIAEALQGTIGVESAIGVGSTFWIWIPCDTDRSKELKRVPLYRPVTKKPDMLSAGIPVLEETENKKTILIAEDIDNNYIILSSIIKENYDIIRAENGLDAIEKTKTFNPDIILMDVKMPLMNGIEATKEIRKFNADIPIIALTAYVFDTNKEDAIHAGCNDFLSKPVNRNVLMHTLDNYK